MGRLSGLSPDPPGGRIFGDGNRDRRHHHAGSDPEFGIIGHLCAGWRLRNSGAALHWREPRGGVVLLHHAAGLGHPGDGRRQALAAPVVGERCWNPYSVCRLV